MDSVTLLVVRVWRAPDGFRASARRVDDEDTRTFTAVSELARYLEACAADPRAAPARRDREGPSP